MKLIRTNTIEPEENLACEEYYFLHSDEDIFMLWRNRPTAVIGRNQNIYAEIDLEYAAKHNIRIIRRITGGGAVYHDFGNINYSFITSRTRAEALDFKYFTAPIIKALASLGVIAELSGRNDLVAGGAKFSGSAQHSDSRRILHHGTLLFSGDLSVMEHILRPDEMKLKKNAVKSVRSRVINLAQLIPGQITPEEFLSRLEDYFKAEYHPQIENADMTAVKSSPEYFRLTSESWLYGRRREYQYTKKACLNAGLVTVLFDLLDGKLKNTAIEGDFFGESDVSLLAEGLNGCICEISALNAFLASANPEQYIRGITPSELAQLIVS